MYVTDGVGRENSFYYNLSKFWFSSLLAVIVNGSKALPD